MRPFGVVVSPPPFSQNLRTFQRVEDLPIQEFVAQPGRPPVHANTNRYDAALVRVIDFEREFGKLPADSQTLLLMAYREKQPLRIIAQITGWSKRVLDYKIPAALLDLARLLDKADLL